MQIKSRIKTPISYYGGKQSMLPHILPKIPVHKVYTESFAGGLAVYWAKEPAKIEVINDQNREATNFYTVLMTDYLGLNALVQTTLHSREAYEDAKVIYKVPHLFSHVKRAWAFWVLTQQGYVTKVGTWGYDKSSGSKERKLDNQKLSFGLHLARRLEGTQIESGDALRIIASRDSEEAFHYVDPPYVNTDCGHYDGYSVEQYIELLDLLSGIKGKFLLSSYMNEYVEEYVRKFGWSYEKHEKQLAASGKKGKKKVEILAWNF